MRNATAWWCAVAVGLWGCSDAARPPAQYSQQLSSADRVEATNQSFSVGLTMTRADADALAGAITSASKNTLGAPMSWTDNRRRWEVAFYEGRNQVLAVSICYDVFLLGGIEYRDGSGVLRSFCVRWEKEVGR